MKKEQSYPTLCDPVDCSPSGSSVHGILLARILEWVAIPSPEKKKKKKNSILQKKKYQENKKELLEIANRQLKLKSQENC